MNFTFDLRGSLGLIATCALALIGWGTQYLFNQVAFGASPEPTTTYVDAALAGYLSGIGDNIIGGYAYAGHGGGDTGEMGMPELTGARPSEIMAAATIFEMDVLTTPLWQDTARTIPAGGGDPVTTIGSVLTAAGAYAGMRSGDVLVVSTTATSDTYTGTLPAAIAPRYVAILMDLFDMTGDEGCMVKIGDLDLLRFSSGWIRADVPGGSVAEQATDLGFGGRRPL